MRVRSLVLAVAFCTFHFSTTNAQEAKACAFDTAAVTRPYRLTVGLTRWWEASADDREPELLIAQAVREHFRAPRSVTLPLPMRVWGPTSYRGPVVPALGFGLHTAILLHLDGAGRLKGSTEVSTAAPELNRAILDAIEAADSAGAFNVIGWNREAKAPRRVVLRTAAYDSAGSEVAPLVTLALPIVYADSGPNPIVIPKPEYPRAAQMNHREGWVDLQYVVTEVGTAKPESFHVINGQAEFVDPSIAVLLKGTFRPASAGGCALPMLVQQRVSYKFAR